MEKAPLCTLTIDFWGIKKYPCLDVEWREHVPHFWYDPTRFRGYFCRGR